MEKEKMKQNKENEKQVKKENKEMININEITEYLPIDTTNNEKVGERLNAIDVLGDTIKGALKEGINNDYAIIQGTNKPSLLQPGARKIVQLFGLGTHFDELPSITSGNNTIIKVKCYLTLPGSGDIISESYGCAAVGSAGRDLGGNYNQATKMAQKRAMIGAVLQVANLSKVFTQDMEDSGITTNAKFGGLKRQQKGYKQFDDSKDRQDKKKINDLYIIVRECFQSNYEQTKLLFREVFNAGKARYNKDYENCYQMNDAEYDDFVDFIHNYAGDDDKHNELEIMEGEF